MSKSNHLKSINFFVRISEQMKRLTSIRPGKEHIRQRTPGIGGRVEHFNRAEFISTIRTSTNHQLSLQHPCTESSSHRVQALVGTPLVPLQTVTLYAVQAFSSSVTA